MKRLLNFIETRLNIRIQRNSGMVFLSMAISIAMCGYSNPCIIKEIVSSLPTQYLSAELLSVCVSTLLIGMIWKGKPRDIVIKNFMIFTTLETVASVVLGFWLLFVSYNVWVMAIASIVYANCISLFVSKCVMTFKSKLFLEKDREDFDNSSATICSIASIVGLTCSAFFMPSLPVAIAFWSLACVFDDIGWMCVYFKNKKKLLEENNK